MKQAFEFHALMQGVTWLIIDRIISRPCNTLRPVTNITGHVTPRNMMLLKPQFCKRQALAP